METLGERIRHLRNKEGLSMYTLSSLIYVPVRDKDGEIIDTRPTTGTTISNIENNKHRPSLDMAVALADFFEVSLDWLIRGEETPKHKRKKLQSKKNSFTPGPNEELQPTFSVPPAIIREIAKNIYIKHAEEFIEGLVEKYEEDQKEEKDPE